MPPRAFVKRVAPARKRDDGYYYLNGNWMDRPMPVYPGERLGVVIGIDGAVGDLPLLLGALDETGDKISKGSRFMLPHGKSATYVIGLRKEHFDRVASVRFTGEVDGIPGSAVHYDAEIYPGLWFMIGGGAGPRASAAQIADLETRLGSPLCEDHREFLSTRGGAKYVWWQAPEWRTEEEGFYAALNEAEENTPDIGLLRDASYLFGLNAHPYLGYPADLGAMSFFDPAFLPHAIPVGVDGGGNLYVQALHGDRRGQVFFLDHELHYGMMAFRGPQTVPVADRADWPDKPYEDLSPDAFWDFMGEVGYAIPCAADLDHMTAALDAHHARLIDTLAPRWRAG